MSMTNEQISIAMGRIIKRERKNRGFSRALLAECIEISVAFVGAIERGERTPSPENMLAFSQLFNMTINELILDRDTNDSTIVADADNENAMIIRNKQDGIMSLIANMDEADLDFIAGFIKSYRQTCRIKERIQFASDLTDDDDDDDIVE